MRILSTLCIAVFFCFGTHLHLAAQVGIGTATPNPRAVLDLTTNNKGFLLPRLTATERTAIFSTASAADSAAGRGMQVYDLADDQIMVWDGTDWQPVGSSGNAGLWQDDGTNTWQNNGGNVGIGTATPLGRFEVAGAEQFGAQEDIRVEEGAEFFVSGIEGYAQGFSPNISGSLEQIDIVFSATGTVNITVEIHAGTDPAVPNLLASEVYTVFPTQGFEFSSIFFTTPAVLTAGQEYYWVVYPTSNAGSLSLPYTGGSPLPQEQFEFNGTNWTSFANEWEFATYIDTGSPFTIPAIKATSSGLVGMGLKNPAATLDVFGSFRYRDGSQQDGYVLTSDAYGYATWQPAGSGGGQWQEIFGDLTTFSNVGIGQNSQPMATLEVSGSFRLNDGSQQNGYVLTTDAGGYASWQPSGGGLWDDNGTDVWYNLTGNVGIGTNVPTTPLDVQAVRDDGTPIARVHNVVGSNSFSFGDRVAFQAQAGGNTPDAKVGLQAVAFGNDGTNFGSVSSAQGAALENVGGTFLASGATATNQAVLAEATTGGPSVSNIAGNFLADGGGQNVGILASSSSNVSGAIAIGVDANASATGTGAINKAIQASASGGDQNYAAHFAEGTVWVESGNLGVGVQDPVVRLHVAEHARIDERLGIGATPTHPLHIEAGQAYVADQVSLSGVWTTSPICAQSFTAGVTGNMLGVGIRMTNLGPGQLQIDMYSGGDPNFGTLLHSETFNIPDGLNQELFDMIFSSPVAITSGDAYHIRCSIPSGNPNVTIDSGNNPYPGGIFYYNFGFWNSFGGNDDLAFQTYYDVIDADMAFTTGGRLGVGTTSPTANLHVRGNARIENLAGSGLQMVVTDNTGTLSKQPLPPTVSSIWQDNGTDTWLTGGNVGIGTNLPIRPLHITGTTLVRADENDILAVFDNLNAGMPFTYGGRVAGLFRTSSTGTENLYGTQTIVESNVNSTKVGSQISIRGNDGDKVGVFVETTGANGFSDFAISARCTSNPFSSAYGVYAEANGTSPRNYALFAQASGGADNFAGYFAQGTVFISNTLGLGTELPTAKLDILGNTATNDYEIRLREGFDPNHALRFAGIGQPHSQFFAGENINGPALYGFGGGTLGLKNGPTETNVLRWFQDGSVGIGTNFTNALLTVNGPASKPGGGTWATFSDRRLKTDILDLPYGLSEIMALRPVTYRYAANNPYQHDTSIVYAGLIAQEAQAVIPAMVQETQDGYLMLDPNIVTWASVKAIQELQTELAALRAENQTLREQLLASPATAGNDTELAALRAEVAQLRQQTDRVATLEARLEQILRLLGEKAQQD